MPLLHTARCRKLRGTTTHEQSRSTSRITAHRYVVKIKRTKADSECFHRGFAHCKSRSQHVRGVSTTLCRLSLSCSKEPRHQPRVARKHITKPRNIDRVDAETTHHAHARHMSAVDVIGKISASATDTSARRSSRKAASVSVTASTNRS